MLVLEVATGGRAHRCRLLCGDFIVAVAGVRGTADTLVKLLCEATGTVELDLLRGIHTHVRVH